MTPSELDEIAAGYTAAWCSGDPQAVAAFYAPNGVLTINGGEPNAGRGAVVAVAESFMATFPDMVLELDRLEQEGERVAYHWLLTGTNAGIEGVAGNVVRIGGCERWRLNADGLIQDSLGSFDAEDYDRQLGLP